MRYLALALALAMTAGPAWAGELALPPCDAVREEADGTLLALKPFSLGNMMRMEVGARMGDNDIDGIDYTAKIKKRCFGQR